MSEVEFKDLEPGSRVKDLRGRMFTRLSVETYEGLDKHGRAIFGCLCICGKRCVVKSGKLIGKRTASCGCLRHEMRVLNLGELAISRDYVGRVNSVGSRVIASVGQRAGNGNQIILVRCFCGIEFTLPASDFIREQTKGCGCLQKENGKRLAELNTTHGMSHERIYKTWHGMHHRCNDRNNEHYGGRGIAACDEWLCLESFVEWALANGYDDHLCIDRIDPDGDYKPSNCQWITLEENSRKAWRDRNNN